jgi:hypothetical protein
MIGADIDARIQPMPFNASAIRGLSEKLLVSHHESNYGGAVKRLNAIRAQLAKIAFLTAPGFEINGLKREELIATNSMILHELYFDSLGGDGTTMEPGMALALAADFGGFSDGVRSSSQSARRSGEDPAGCCSSSSLAKGRSLTSGQRITRKRWRAACRSLRSTCTSTLITWTTARLPGGTSTR